jgi:hypothetical protein
MKAKQEEKMSDEEGTKTDEAGKTKSSIEEFGYDYNHAISEATRLWSELKERHAARQWKYPPNDAVLEHLLSAWRANPGKALAHLFDLPYFVHVQLDADGIGILKDAWSKLVAKYQFRGAFRQHHAVYSTTTGKHHTISIHALRKLSAESSVDLDTHTTAIRAGANGKSLALRFPMRIDSQPLGRLFGYYGDLIHQKVRHTTKDEAVQKDFANTVTSALGDLKITVNRRRPYTATYTTSFIQHLFTVGGVNTQIRQLLADNPGPLFLLESPIEVVRAYLGSLFESEGGVSYNEERDAAGSVDLHQGVICNPSNGEQVPRHPGKVSYIQFGSPTDILDAPPRLLISAALLLLRFDISSRLYPASLYTNEYNEKVMRWKVMITGSDIAQFRQHIGFISAKKREQLRPKT